MKVRKSLAAVMLTTTACTSLQPVQPAPYITAEQPGQVVVFDAAGVQYVVNDPRVTSDSLVGFDAVLLRPISLPMNEVEEVLVRRPNAARTTLMAVVGAAAVVGLVVVLTSVTGECVAPPSDTGLCTVIPDPDFTPEIPRPSW